MKRIKSLLLLPVLFTLGCSISGDYKYDDTGYQVLDGASLSLDNIHNVEVNWVNGNVYCSQSAETTITVSETESEYPLYYKIKDDELSIQLTKSGTSSRVIDKLNKDLTLSLPASLYTLSMNLVKTKANFDGNVAMNKGEFNIVDGKCSFETYAASESNFKITNADLDIKCLDVSYSQKNIMLTDGEGGYQLLGEPQEHKIDINVVNASIKVGINSEIGYKLDWTQVNSRFICEYGENRYDYGNKLINLDVNAVNADFKITKIVTM